MGLGQLSYRHCRVWLRNGICSLPGSASQPAAKGAGSASKSGQGAVLVTPRIDGQNTRTSHAQLRMCMRTSAYMELSFSLI